MGDRARIGLLFQIWRTHEVSSRFVERALEPTGMRGDDYGVYSYLLHGPLTLTDLAEGTGLPLTTAAGYVRRFVDRGHVERTPNPADGRSTLLRLTPGAREMVLDIAAVFSKTVSYLDDVLDRRGVQADDLIDQLGVVQDVIGEATDDLDTPGR